MDGGTDLARGDVGDQLVTVLDGLAIDGDDDVAELNAGLGCALAGSDGVDQDAPVGEAVFAADRSGYVTLEADADGAAHDLVLRPDEHVVDVDDDVGGHGKADALRAHRLGVDGGIHADDLAGHVDERTAGVARVDGGVRLDEPLELVDSAVGAGLVDGAVLGGDDAGGDGLTEREWTADGEHPIANLGAVGVAHLDGRQARGGIDLDNGDVSFGVDADNVGRAAVVGRIVAVGGELHVDLVGFVDDVVVGDDVAAGVHDEAGAERLVLVGGVGAVIAAHSTLAAEEAIEEVLHVAGSLVVRIIVVSAVGRSLAATGSSAGGGLFGQGDGVDVDHRGTDLLRNLGEVVGKVDRVRHGERAGVGGVDRLLLAADAAGDQGAGEDADGERGQQREGRREAVGANALEKIAWGLLRCVHR